jgi:hypothetical protein
MDAFGVSPFWLPVSIHQDDQQTSGWIPGEFQENSRDQKSSRKMRPSTSSTPREAGSPSRFKGWDHQAMMYITYIYISMYGHYINPLYKIYYDI